MPLIAEITTMSSKATYYRRKRAKLFAERGLGFGIVKTSIVNKQSSVSTTSLVNPPLPTATDENSSENRIRHERVRVTSPDVLNSDQLITENVLNVGLVQSSCRVEECSLESVENYSCSVIASNESVSSESNNACQISLRDTQANITPRKEVILLAELFSRHKLTETCINDVFNVFNQCRNESRPVTSLRQIDKELNLNQFNATFYWRCSDCDSYKEVEYKDTPYSVTCCSKIGSNADHFIVLDSRSILQRILTGKSVNDVFYEKKKYLKSLDIANEEDLFITLNTDGATLFKSSNSSIWPVLGVIDGLVHFQKKQNVLLLGIWISKGSKKPNFIPFINAVIRNLNYQLDNPIQWKDDTGKLRRSRVFVSSMVCDSIARPAVQMVSQFNGQFGCGICYHDEKGHYFKHCESVKLRSQTDYLAALENECGETFGVLGRSPLLNAPHFDVIFDFPLDVLHTVYLGVTALITEAWFKKKTSYCLKESELDQILLQIQPPKRVSRLPRSLKYRGSYKGHEWNMWLLYYSPIVLLGKLNAELYDHWLLLVNGISLLTTSQRYLTDEMIERAQCCLYDFSSRVERLYGRSTCRFNVHLLLHLPLFVKRFGPLYLFSMTVFESFNMVLSGYVKSSFGVGTQIIKSYFRDITVRFHVNQNEPQSVEQECLSEVFTILPANYVTLLRQKYQDNVVFKVFSRFRNRKGKILHSSSYNQLKKRNNSWFVLSSNSVMNVKYFVQIHSDSKEVSAIGEKHIICDCNDVQVSHIFETQTTESFLVNVNLLYDNVFIIKKHEKTFVVSFVNNVECYAE